MKRAPQFRRTFSDHLSDYVTAIAWSNNSMFAISAAGELVQWQMQGNRWKRHDFEIVSTTSHSSLPSPSLNCLGLSADGNYLAVGGQSSTLSIWESNSVTWKLVHTQRFGSHWLDQLAWHPTQPILAVGVGQQVYIWKIPASQPHRILEFESSTVLNLTWHPSGSFLAVGGHGGVKIWDIREQTTPSVLQVPGASLSAAWSPDGTFLASGNLDRTLSVMDFGHPPPWLMQGFPGKVSAVAWASFSHERFQLAAVASDGISIWTQDSDQNWQSKVLTDHQSLVRDIAVQPSGPLLASASDEPHINLWTRAKKLQQQLPGPSEGTHCLAWNPTGELLAVGGQDGSILVFEIVPEGKGFG